MHRGSVTSSVVTDRFGINIRGTGTRGNLVQGNFIGTDANGTGANGNVISSIIIDSGAQENLIGGLNDTPGEKCSGQCNLISENGFDGVQIIRASTMSNTVRGNHIGMNVSGTAAIGNVNMGIQLGAGAAYNLIGGDSPSQRNLVSGNQHLGITIA